MRDVCAIRADLDTQNNRSGLEWANARQRLITDVPELLIELARRDRLLHAYQHGVAEALRCLRGAS